MASLLRKLNGMKFFSGLTFSFLLLTAVQNTAIAQKGLPKFNRKAMIDSMTPEEKKEMRKRLKAKYDSLPPEQKEKIKERVMNRMDSMTPQQKKRILKQLKDNKPATPGQ